MRLDKTNHRYRPGNRLSFTILILTLAAMLLTPGCWNYKEVNNTAVPVGIILDIKNNRPFFATEIAKPISREQGGSTANQSIIVSETGHTFVEAARRTMLTIPRLPLWAHARTVVIGPNLASHDMALATDFLARNRHVRKTTMVFVFDGKNIEECLEAKVPLESYSTPGLIAITKAQEDQLGIYTPCTLEDLTQKFATPGVDPAVPRVSVTQNKDKKFFRLDGTAVFKGRKMVGFLNETESKGYRFLNPGIIKGGYIVIKSPLENAGPHDFVGLDLIRSNARVKPLISGKNIKMKIEILAEGNYNEQTFVGEVLTLDMIKKTEQLANRQIEQDIYACIAKAQSLNSDIFGWGQEIHRTNPDLWKQVESKWNNEVFPDIEVKVSADYKIRRTYVTDQSFKFK